MVDVFLLSGLLLLLVVEIDVKTLLGQLWLIQVERVPEDVEVLLSETHVFLIVAFLVSCLGLVGGELLHVLHEKLAEVFEETIPAFG